MSKENSAQSQKFGTFLGVYMPSILTILGLIMYLRFGWVVGNVGLGLTLLIVLLASSITFITGLSASSIATNINIGVGGEYFLISRSLGIETGGAIGIPLYFCRTLSVTFYCFGMAEATLMLWPPEWGILPSYALQGLAALLIIMVTILSSSSASLVLKLQIPILILMVLSILAFAAGILTNEMHAPIMESNYQSAPEGFWYVFAVFFPAVTGFTAGIGMSGDLKDPRKSIPIGTLGAVVTGLVVYMIVPVLFAVTAIISIDQLTDQNYGLKAWSDVALFGSILIIPAVLGGIISSSFGCILGAPRVLQALSMDGLAPKFLSKLSKSGQPAKATWITGFIALSAVLLGDLNTIAQFVSVLFLTLYVTINISAAVEDLVNEPSYRPQLRVPWYISILGALGAIGVMFLVSPWACFVAVVVISSLYIWIRSRSLVQQWGDVSAGFWINMARLSMLKLKNTTIHGRNWRPLMLAFVRDINKRINLIKLAEYLGQNHGILTIANLTYKGKDNHLETHNSLIKDMNTKLESYGLQAFCEVHQVDDFQQGIVEIAKGHGLGDLKTNTIVFGYSEEKEGLVRSLITIDNLAESGQNILICRFNEDLPEKANSIDIWWGGQQNNGDLMLLLAYLLKLNLQWSKAKIRILSLVLEEASKLKLEKGIKDLLPKARIKADVDIVVSIEPFATVLVEKSKNSDLVFLGLQDIEKGSEAKVGQNLEILSKDLKTTVFVQNNGMSDSIPILLKV